MSEEIDAPPAAPLPQQANFEGDAEPLEKRPKPTDSIDKALTEQDSKPVRCAKFRQQELWAWKPVWSPQLIVVMYIIVSIIFIPLGVIILVQSSNLYSTSLLRYDAGNCAVGNETTIDSPANTCTIRLRIDRDIIKQPSYFYYGVTNFYQNARTYVSSRSDEQLRNTTNPDTSNCEPLEFINSSDPSSGVLNPCGLTAQSQFNDTFTFCKDSSCNRPVKFNGTNISWRIDRETRFAPGTSEDFMVWMRLAAFNSWKKLYRRIEEDLEKGNYFVKIESRFPVSGFGGKKFFYIAQTTWFGGPNQPLAIFYIAVGCISLVIAVFFGIKSRVTADLDLPPETSVYLKGLVKNPVIPKHSVNYPSQPSTV